MCDPYAPPLVWAKSAYSKVTKKKDTKHSRELETVGPQAVSRYHALTLH